MPTNAWRAFFAQVQCSISHSSPHFSKDTVSLTENKCFVSEINGFVPLKLNWQLRISVVLSCGLNRLNDHSWLFSKRPFDFRVLQKLKSSCALAGIEAELTFWKEDPWQKQGQRGVSLSSNLLDPLPGVCSRNMSCSRCTGRRVPHLLSPLVVSVEPVWECTHCCGQMF